MLVRVVRVVGRGGLGAGGGVLGDLLGQAHGGFFFGGVHGHGGVGFGGELGGFWGFEKGFWGEGGMGILEFEKGFWSRSDEDDYDGWRSRQKGICVLCLRAYKLYVIGRGVRRVHGGAL